MAIGINTIGNYSAYGLSNTKTNKANSKNPAMGLNENLNQDEKKFFAEMYPAKQNEIMDYYYYERSGKMNGIAIGTNFDRRG